MLELFALFFDGGEDLQLDAVFGAAGGAFHAHQVVEGADQDTRVVQFQLARVLYEIVVARRPRRSSEAVEWSVWRIEGEGIAELQRACVELEWKVRWCATQGRMELTQCGCEKRQIGAGPVVTDVEIEGDRR